MSSHVLDLSGQRQIQATLNDPAVTRFWVPAKPGDDTEFSFGAREVRIALPPNAKVQRRVVTVQKPMRGEDGKLVQDDDGNYLTEDSTETRLVLVLGTGISGFVRASLTPDEREAAIVEAKPPIQEQHTHTTTTVKRRGDEEWHYLEAGEIETEFEIGSLLDDFERQAIG